MKTFLILGDMHGRRPRIHYKNFDAIICTGDFFYDEDIKKPYRQAYRGFMKNPYAYKDWYEIVGKKKAKQIIKKSIAMGKQILEELNSFGVPVYMVPGNWDDWGMRKEKWEFLNHDFFNDILKNLGNLVDIHKKIKQIGGYTLVGYGFSNGPELYQNRAGYHAILKKADIKKNKKRYSTSLKEYSSLFKKAKKYHQPIIFLSHNTPYNTKIDMIKDKNSIMYHKHYGSLITRKMIDKYHPFVCIGGHMHEHFTKCKVGKTTCIAAGFGPDANILLKLDKGRVAQLKFYHKR